MFRRTAAFFLLFWLLGFVWFAVALPGPLGKEQADVVIVVTGGKGRIERGIEVLRKGWARKMLVSGVDREVMTHEFEAHYGVSHAMLSCCITLGYGAYDTRSNAVESAEWVRAERAKSVRLITSDWHMRRAAYEIGRVMPKGVVMVRDAVPSQPSLGILFLEYHKLIARVVYQLWLDRPWKH